jgi:hypothetical protein
MTPELIIALALTAADYSQTSYIAAHPYEHCEKNPLIHEHPSQARVAGYFALSSAALIALNLALPVGHARTLNLVWAGVEGGNVLRNARIGINFNF